MSESMQGKRRQATVVWSVSCLVLLAAGLAYGDFGSLFAKAAARISPAAVFATVPGHVAAVLLYTAALTMFGSGVSYLGCLAARLLRDAVDNLVVILPGLGEVICARALVLAGARSHAAVTATMLDKITETLAHLPFVALAGFLLIKHWAGAGGGAWSMPSLVTVFAGFALVAAAVMLAGVLMRATRGLPGRIAARIRRELRIVAAEYREQKRGIPRAFVLHVLARAMDGVQVWMIAMTFGLQLGFYEALVVASAANAARVILFFVPAGLVAQEAGFVAGGLLFGIAAPQALTLSLVMRLRDVVFGVPLLVWPVLEYRHGRKPRANPAQ
ncbi:MAG: flippase-like domain-containing protein [Novosphingobium sp.]|jgi:hypothetical protein|nr:flippase-like domain-containing protein [Novosphingobium sp.]